jgi:ATP-dependent RNA helicase DHX57
MWKMVKGKGKSTASTAGPPSSSGKGNKVPAQDDFIFFANDTKGDKGKRGAPSNSKTSVTSTPGGGNEGPPKPTVKQLIGGQSWTGKLPVNLLSEHCQKQKWENPEYDTVRVPYLYPINGN